MLFGFGCIAVTPTIGETLHSLFGFSEKVFVMGMIHGPGCVLPIFACPTHLRSKKKKQIINLFADCVKIDGEDQLY